jgi:hypothetical protein
VCVVLVQVLTHALISAVIVKSPVESQTDSRTGGILSKEQLKAGISPRMSPHIKPRERTNSVTSSTSANWIQRLNTTTKASAATHSTGVFVSGDIQSHISLPATLMLGDHDGDSNSVLTASPALSAIDRLTLQRTRSLDLKSDTTHSNETLDLSPVVNSSSIGGATGGEGGGSGDSDDDNKPQKPEGIAPAPKVDSIPGSKDDLTISDQPSGEQLSQKPATETSNTLWSWFAKPKDVSIQHPKEAEQNVNRSSDPPVAAVESDQPTPSVNIPDSDNKANHSASQPHLSNTPESTNTASGSHTSSSWGYFFSNSTTANKAPQSSAMEKTISQTESMKSTAASAKEKAANSPEPDKSSPRLSAIKDEVSSLKKKGSVTSLNSTAKSLSSQRTGSATAKADEDKSKQVVIIERSASQDKSSDTASVTQSSEVNGGKITSTKNVVLPSFNSQFKYTPTIDNMSNSTSTSLLNKALSAINGMFASRVHKSYNSHDNLSRLKGISEKMAHFIQDMQLEPETVAGKRFVIVGVHG